MLWAISCVDRPNGDAARAKCREAHSAYLKNHKGVIVLCGATLNDDGSAPVGTLYVIKAASRAEAQSFADNEPFSSGGVFASVNITRMRKGQLNPGVAEGE
jgi:uncharacterized protein YciI